MLAEQLVRSVDEMDRNQMVEECRDLEDAYAEALKDNAGFDALSKVWKRIQDLHRSLERNSGAKP